MYPVAVATAAVVALIGVLYARWRLREARYPPAPQKLPIFGNLFQIPRLEPWIWCSELKERYGDISMLSVFGQPLIILNTVESISDLLLKRSSIYSDRPQRPLAGKIVGLDQSTTLAPYGPYWRLHRRLWHQYLGKASVAQYADVVEHESQQLVLRLLEGKSDPFQEIKLAVIKMIARPAFGMEVNSLEDDFIASTEQVVQDVVESFDPGRYLVDVFPMLQHIPDWFPGTGWKQIAFRMKQGIDRMVNEPYEHVKKHMHDSTAPRSFISDMIQGSIGDDHAKKWVAGTVYGGGVENSMAALTHFVAAMLLYPDVQRRAQMEIESTIGSHRLPGFADKGNLPYVDAMIKEVLRWEIVAPFGVPHSTSEDDVYRGYTIPKGSLILPNYWTVSQDPNEYPDPNAFKPERFLEDVNDLGRHPPLDPRVYVFGIGRRACAGRDFAELALYSQIVTLLASCTIARPLDKTGVKYLPKISFGLTSIRGTNPFPFRVLPRSLESTQLLVKGSGLVRGLKL